MSGWKQVHGVCVRQLGSSISMCQGVVWMCRFTILICVLMFMYYIVCYFTGIFYAVVRQNSVLFIDNKDSVLCILSVLPFPSSSSCPPLPILFFLTTPSYPLLPDNSFLSSSSCTPLPILLFLSSPSYPPLPGLPFLSSSSCRSLPILLFISSSFYLVCLPSSSCPSLFVVLFLSSSSHTSLPVHLFLA